MNNPFHPTADAAGADNADTMALDLSGVETPVSAETPQAPAATHKGPGRRRRWPLVAGATLIALVATGAVAYGNAKKTVQLDIDGEVTTVDTFAGSVSGLLNEEDIRIGDRDLVAPATDAALRNGSDVVVRYGREVTVDADGKQSDVWITALDADEALETLAERGGDVKLVASRSAAEGRPSLPLRLDANGPVNVVVDGATKVAPDGSIGLNAILDQQGVVLGDLDRVHVERDDAKDPAVSLVIQRVVVADVPTTTPIDFETVTEQDANRFKDLGPRVRQEGVAGVTTTVNRVTTVDGVEEARELISTKVTTAPVNKIVVEGTKARPKPPVVVEKPKAPVSSSNDSSSTGSGSGSSGGSGSDAPQKTAPPAPPAAAGAGVWAALAQCESGGNPATNTGNGYYGLYQFSAGTWAAMGGSGLPSNASAAEQTMRAQKLQAQSGWGQWPACSRKLGLR